MKTVIHWALLILGLYAYAAWNPFGRPGPFRIADEHAYFASLGYWAAVFFDSRKS